MKISKFNVNRSKSDFCFKTASFVSDGLMSADDHILLHSLKEMSGKNIEQINMVGPDMTELSPKFDAAKERLAEQETTLERLYYLTESQGYCGRVWDESSASPVAKTYCGNLEMLQNLPELLGLGGYLVQNDHTRRKLSKENHYFFEDSTEAKLDGSMGHYQWGWNRPFYITTWNENNLFFECISFEPIKGRESYYVPVGSMSASGHAAIDRETDTLVSYCNMSPRYRGGNNNAEFDTDEEKTLLGRCVTYKTPAAFVEAAHKNGTGWYAGSMRMTNVVTILFHIIMGTRNSQSNFNSVKNSDGLYECGLGMGVSDIFTNTNPFINLNVLAEYGDFTGTSDVQYFTYKNYSEDITKPYTIPVFFGLKNPYGYIYKLSEDEFGSTTDNPVKTTHYIKKSLYDDTEFGINEQYIVGSSFLHNGTWIKDMSYKNLELWPIDIEAGSLDTYYCDTVTYGKDTGIIKSVHRTGVYSLNPGYCNGLSTLHVGHNSLNNYYLYMGSYLCEFTEDFLLEPIIT